MGFYYSITSEMIALGLKGNELLVFAVIYSMTQGKAGLFIGGPDVLAAFIGSTERTARSLVVTLQEKGLIRIKQALWNNRIITAYQATEKFSEGGKNFQNEGKNFQDEGKNFPENAEKISAYNNTDINKELINKDIKKKEKLYKKKYGETVSLTEEEHAKLTASLGEEMTAACIQKLDLYKQANGKTYKSDYAAILNWVVTRVAEERQKAAPSGKMGFLEQNHQLCEEAKAFFTAAKPDTFTEPRKNITGNPYEAMLRKNGYYDQHPELDPERHPELYLRK